MENSIVSFKMNKSVVKNQSATYVIEDLKRAATLWFEQDEDFMKELCYKCKEYAEKNKEIMFPQNQECEVYAWDVFFKNFKPSISNIERSMERIQLGQVLIKTENHQPEHYNVIANKYPSHGQLLIGAHTRCVEQIGRVMGIIQLNEGVDLKFSSEVKCTVYEKTDEDYKNHVKVVTQQDCKRDAMTPSQTNAAFASSVGKDSKHYIEHRYAYNQQARASFAKNMMVIDNNSKLYMDFPDAYNVLTAMVNCTFKTINPEDYSLHSDIMYPLWKSCEESLGFETAQKTPDSIFSGILESCLKKISAKKDKQSVEDVCNTVALFMSYSIESLLKKGDIGQNVAFSVQEAVHVKHTGDKYRKSMKSSHTQQSWVGALMKEAFEDFYDNRALFKI